MLTKNDLLRTTAVALSVAALASSAALLPSTASKAATLSVQLAANPCNPCAAANPCNPCNPCAAAACNPCNPCAAANPCNPCAAANPCNPCAAANPCNPCAAANPCNPCSAAWTDEERLWGLIKHSDVPGDFNVYLDVYPNGQYAATARERIVKLGGEISTGSAPQSVDLSKIEALDATFVVQCNANLRESASAKSSRVGVLAGGSDIQVTGKLAGQNWYKVKTAGGAEGYVFGPLIRQTKISSDQSATSQ